MPGLAALLWIKLPGESDGICGGETTYLFSPIQARRLIVNSPFVPAQGRELAAAADVSPSEADRTGPDQRGGLPPEPAPPGGKPLTSGSSASARHDL